MVEYNFLIYFLFGSLSGHVMMDGVYVLSCLTVCTADKVHHPERYRRAW